MAAGWGNLGWVPKPPFRKSKRRPIRSVAVLSNRRPDLSRSRLVQLIGQDRAGWHRPAAPPARADCGRRRAPAPARERNPGPAVLPVGREVGPAVEHLAVGRQEGRERPAALAGDRLHRPLVARVDVGPLVAVDLDADEMSLRILGELGVLVGLAVHHVAPVAPHRADIEQDRAIVRARAAAKASSDPRNTSGSAGGRRNGDRRCWPCRVDCS